MADLTKPVINGHRYSWSSIEIDLGDLGGIQTGVSAISYQQSLEPSKLRGAGSPQPSGRTRGEYDAEGSVSLYKEDADNLIALLGNGFMEKVFDITVSYADTGNPVRTDKLFGCRIQTDEQDFSPGGDALEVTFSLNVMKLQRNGFDPLLNMR